MRDYVLFGFLFLNMVLITKPLPSVTDKIHIQRKQKREVSLGAKKAVVNDDIIFPDVISSIPSVDQTDSKESFNHEDFSASGKGLDCIENVCEDAKEYPYDRIKEIAGRLSSYNKLFGYLEGNIVTLPSRWKPDQEPASESLCAATIHTKYPKTLKNENNTERFIVNVEGHKQGLVFETCLQKAKCEFGSLFPTDYIYQCTQKYARRRLMALGEDGNEAFDTFVVPSCCVCTVRKLKT